MPFEIVRPQGRRIIHLFSAGPGKETWKKEEKYWKNGVYPEKPMSYQAENSHSGGQNIVEMCPYLLKTNGIKNVTKCHSLISKKCLFFVKNNTATEIRIIKILQNHTILCFNFKPAGEIAFLPGTNKNQVLPTGSFHHSDSQNRIVFILPPGFLPTLNTSTGCSEPAYRQTPLYPAIQSH
jgi:hypothetical protein